VSVGVSRWRPEDCIARDEFLRGPELFVQLKD
jgi:hypothetical protein